MPLRKSGRDGRGLFVCGLKLEFSGGARGGGGEPGCQGGGGGRGDTDRGQKVLQCLSAERASKAANVNKSGSTTQCHNYRVRLSDSAAMPEHGE